MTNPDHNTGSPVPLNEHAADSQGRDGAGVLLGLEPQPTPDIEKAGQNSNDLTDLDSQPCYAPLLGTIFPSQGIPKPSTKWRISATLSLVLFQIIRSDLGPSHPVWGHDSGP
jgi:hypothetical protein